MSVSKLVKEGVIQVRRPNSDKDRAHLQAAKRIGPAEPGKVVIRKKGTADPKTTPEPKAGEPSKEDMLKKVQDFWKSKAGTGPKKDDAEHKSFQKWLSTPGKERRQPATEEIDKAGMHHEVATALRKLARKDPANAPKHRFDANRKMKLARKYRKVQTPPTT